MRRARPHSIRSAGRLKYRHDVNQYMSGSLWNEVRIAWRLWFRQTFDQSPRCLVCGAFQYDLHHAVANHRFGDERRNDLIPLCRYHHELLHRALDTNKAYRLMAPGVATEQIVAGLKERVAAGGFISPFPGYSPESLPSWSAATGWAGTAGDIVDGAATVINVS